MPTLNGVDQVSIHMDEQQNLTALREPPKREDGLSDEGLMVQFQHGRSKSDFEEIIRRQQHFVYRAACCLTANDTVADDVVQDVFLQLSHPKVQFRDMGCGSFKAWLFRVTKNMATRHIKKEKRLVIKANHLQSARAQMRMEPSNDGNQEQGAAVRDALQRAIKHLSEDVRVPLSLYYLEGISQTDISKMTGVSQSQISRRIQGGLASLKRHLFEVGITVPMIMLPGMLKDLGIQEAPLHLQEVLKQIRISDLSSPQFLFKAWHGFVAMVMFVFCSGFAWYYMQTRTINAQKSKGRVTEQVASNSKPEGKRSKYWNFNQEESWPSDGVMEGSIEWQPTGGIDNTGCWVTKSQYCILRIPFDASRLPLKISMRTKFNPQSQFHAVETMVIVAWDKPKELGLFHNIGRPQMMLKEQWSGPITNYVSNNSVDGWNGAGTRYSFTYAVPEKGASLALYINGSQLIDDLRIEEIDAETMPEQRIFQIALASVPSEKRNGTVVIESIPSTNPKEPVSILFSHPSAEKKGLEATTGP